MLELFKRSGVPFEVHNSHTTVDAPQTVYHIREKFKELENLGIKCEIEKPPINKSDPKKRRFTMWSLSISSITPFYWFEPGYFVSVLYSVVNVRLFPAYSRRLPSAPSSQEKTS